MKAGAKEFVQRIQRLSALVKQSNCFDNFGSNAKKIAFYHDKDIEKLKLGCALPNLANICIHKSTDAKFYLFTEGDEVLSENSRRVWSWYSF